ncbi:MULTISPECIES: glycerol-3-phosphate dehydrogenase/oxidase [unclassified Modestobacter]|uniref:glycerol-3-phosphate dehydrogenase/oxidase n=1 Tax=unclassified Modestobacter TaxID=2643866 RepID=UPI0022AAAD38|nr:MULTISPECIES: glycerol-3-phosphate dehydrogenase/oxidase [unclassified Modestobacter]MCZ2823054.1 glycerol-3-phosphate dehydrogenase/oxidase [Modestobacter sp. VKM Ac-2981]MCZ2851300.1 glycerol-3-phosphate dehydrogenase/oxidase [Modestobacter sp. VKM Ac-2982]
MTAVRTLGPEQRAQAWADLAAGEFEVLVIGGGVTGAGVALDAATRGLRTALVEARDFASGTSSRSSKLFHGGLRYLEQFDFGLVREALHERDLSVNRIAPHLVKPVPFLYPLTRHWERPYVTAGITLYDGLARLGSLSAPMPAQKQLTRTGARRLFPALKPDSLVGAIRYYDAQADDARHTLSVALTAASYGATVLNSAEVVSFSHAGGRVVGARVRDVETGNEVDVRSEVVVNATGVWTDDIQTLVGGRGRFHVRASKGVHIVVPRDRINGETGLILRTEKSVLFVIPWGSHWIVGTTDTDWELDKAHPAASKADIDYILDHVNEVLSVPLTHEDITGVYAGLRPLLSGESESTSQLSREHAVARPMPGVISVAGGKYTTYRPMAADAVDAAADDVTRRVPPSVTENIPLVGAEGYAAMVNSLDGLSDRWGIPRFRAEHLINRFGSLTPEVLGLAAEAPELLDPVPGAEEYLMVEMVWSAAHEAALHLDDLLARRTRISIETPHRGVESAEPVARAVAGVLGWDEERITSEVQSYRARVEAERRSQEATDDQEADAARIAAPDTRAVAVGRALG